MARHTKAIIHLDAIKANYQLANQLAPDSQNIAVIKANAYGHGCIEVARHLESMVPAFAVAFIEEAVELRDGGITKPILILEGINEPAELEYAIHHDIWVMVESELQCKLITASALQSKLHVWLKLDTGMHRLGLSEKHFPVVYEQLSSCAWVSDAMVACSHMACASDTDSDMTRQQLKRFLALTKDLSLTTSIANSAALSGFPKTRLHWNRPGIMLYGVSPFDSTHPLDINLKPAMTFTSTVIGIRNIEKGETVGYGATWKAKESATIATIGAGYADGYPRHAANGTPILVAGQNAKLAGQVSMDMITADVSQCSGIKIGDPVELWGEHVNANDVAFSAKTISYELLTSVSQRVPRVYK